MTISTYTELQTALTNWLGRSDLSDRYAEFIANAEARLNRALRVRDMETSSSLSLSSGSASLPSNYLEWLSARWVGDREQDLLYVEPDSEAWRFRYRPNGDPTMFTILAGSLHTRPSGGSDNVTLYYYRSIPDLATNSTNWLLTKAPDLYLNASLLEACVFVLDDDRARSFWSLVEQDINRLNGEADSNKVWRREGHGASVQDKAESRNIVTGPV
jgi:hypothetical protein